MNHETLRVLFEWLCDHLEDDSGPYHFHFQAGYGLEYPHEVVMVFVFDAAMLVFRFAAGELVRDDIDRPAITSDQCLHMIRDLQDFDSFQRLFSSSEST